jgi:hypothetical protein
VLKYQVGFMGHQVREEGQRIFDELALKTLGKWQQLVDEVLGQMNRDIKEWETMRLRLLGNGVGNC